MKFLLVINGANITSANIKTDIINGLCPSTCPTGYTCNQQPDICIINYCQQINGVPTALIRPDVVPPTGTTDKWVQRFMIYVVLN